MRYLTLAIGLALFVVSALAFEAQYFRWRGCFNELGRCVDPITQVVYHQQSGLTWGLAMGVGAAITALALWRIFKAGASQQKTPR